MVFSFARSILCVLAVSVGIVNAAFAQVAVTDQKYYTSAYVIENDEQAKVLISILRELVAKNLIIAHYHFKNAFEGYVESLRNYVLAKYKTLDVSRIGITDQELHEIQTKALDQLACNDLRLVNQNISSSNFRGASAKLKLYERHIARAKIHNNDLRVMSNKQESLHCEISRQDLTKLQEKIQSKNAQLGMNTQPGLSSINQSIEKNVSIDSGKLLNSKDETSVMGK